MESLHHQEAQMTCLAQDPRLLCSCQLFLRFLGYYGFPVVMFTVTALLVIILRISVCRSSICVSYKEQLISREGVMEVTQLADIL